ncbi:MAG: CD225/dispanin family protein [Bacteroidales bacterium]|nr:CD225/dispanin family protein [Bacteroidales bacterium]
MDKMYYYRSGNTQIGPVPVEQMRGVVTPSTYVWATGMSTWKQAAEVPELMSQLSLFVPSQNTIMPPKPDNHLVLSIIAILACLPLGIVALIMSLQCDSAYNRGDYNDAVSKAKLAKTLSLVGLISFGALIVTIILSNIIIPILFAALAAMSSV